MVSYGKMEVAYGICKVMEVIWGGIAAAFELFKTYFARGIPPLARIPLSLPQAYCSSSCELHVSSRRKLYCPRANSIATPISLLLLLTRTPCLLQAETLLSSSEFHPREKSSATLQDSTGLQVRTLHLPLTRELYRREFSFTFRGCFGTISRHEPGNSETSKEARRVRH